MKTMNRMLTIATTVLLNINVANAVVLPEQASKLNNQLTPFGSERVGNADGSIPAWDGGITKPPVGLGYEGDGDHHPDPYASDKVLKKINASNMAAEGDKISDGLKAMLTQYNESFYLNVYPSHRSHAMPQWVYDNTQKNATNATLVEGGNGVFGAYGGIPFPIPQSAQEIIWNHLMRFNGTYRTYNQHWIHVEPNGSKTEEFAQGEMQFPYYMEQGSESDWNGDIMLVSFQYLEPTRKKGEYIMIREAADQVATPRRSWRYLPGARRVRRAPTLAYDSPIGPAGSRTIDDTRAYNGAIDRYDWKLVGKREMYIPYNSYQIESDKVSLDSLLTAKHLNPEFMRFELHRVWVVEATLKGDASHIYGKRRFYIDEDSWAAVLIDTYDTRDNLWRVTVNHVKNLYEGPFTDGKTLVVHDLQRSSYQALGLHNDDTNYMYTQLTPREDKYYTPAQLRKRAKR